MKNTTRSLGLALVALSLLLAAYSRLQAKSYEVWSPDKRIRVGIDVGEKIEYSVSYDSREILIQSLISMTLNGGIQLGKSPQVESAETKSVDEIIRPVVQEKRKVVLDRYNELAMDFDGDYGLVFKVYDDGVAYRFVTRFPNEIIVESEEATFKFAKDDSMYFPLEESFFTHSERPYKHIRISEVSAEQMSYMPVLVDVQGGPKVAIAEADLDDYPGMYLRGSDDGSPSLIGKFPAYPLREELQGDRDLKVTQRADYIARTEGERVFPWRVIIVAEKDGDLIENDIIYRLAKPLWLKDASWVRPGKVAWDWWNARNIYGVSFKAGINPETYKYYVDFAAEHNIDYVILDEGWSKATNLLDVNPNLDMEELTQHAHQKGVGLILWCIWVTLDEQLAEVLDASERWGVAGLKVDFMQRDDQKAVNFYHKIAREAAKRHLLVDFHGAYKPTGLRRAYPNVLTREGVQGLEWSKWSEAITPEHDVTIPFTRMLVGPMDFTPGAMVNAQKSNFRAIFTRPMSQGTRVHQLAMYVVYESPLQMLADSPSNYMREPEMMRFLSAVPTVWDETAVLEAKVADYVIVARKRGEEWYVGAMTDWSPRSFEIELSFLDDEEYTAEIYCDGPNADRYASDFKVITTTVTRGETVQIELASGGGWAARMYKRHE